MERNGMSAPFPRRRPVIRISGPDFFGATRTSALAPLGPKNWNDGRSGGSS
jgi:hypothetical protein